MGDMRCEMWAVQTLDFGGEFWYTWRMDIINETKLDKTALSIASLADESDEKAFWLAKTPYERLLAMEQMRQIVYGYHPATTRLQRVLTVTELE